MSPLEAMARALYSTQGRCEAWESLEGGNAEGWLLMARAALTALRDNGVTEGMRAAYDDMDCMGGSLKSCFRAMLDAALEEQ